VLSEAMMTALALAPDRALPELRASLRASERGRRELAILALGESRRSDALDALLEAMEDAPSGDRAVYFTALALHRSAAALAALLPWLESSKRDAERALDALAVRRFEPSVRERVREAASAAGRAALFLARFGDEQGESS